MLNVVMPEFQTLITMVGTGFGFIVLIASIRDAVYNGFYETLRHIR